MGCCTTLGDWLADGIRALFKQTVCSGKTLPRSLPRFYTMSFISQRSQKSQRTGSRSRSRGPSSRSASMGAYGGGGPASSMSQGGVPGGGVVKLKKQIPSVECKYFDTQLNTAGVVNNWTQIDSNDVLSGIVQGTGPSQRVGRKIKVVGFVVRLGFSTSPGGWCFDLVRDKQCNGVAATAAQIYTAPNRYGTLPNPFEETRFQFLKRMENFNTAQALANVTAAAAPLTECAISFVKKCSIMVEYNATTGAVSDLTSDNVQLYCNSTNNTAGATPVTPITTGTIRVLYTDA
ncbi:MAG: putative coat protein [Cressdnaviricota sp.]|nr:MAG: putative coat protein [Cressdnaviricota sp.]